VVLACPGLVPFVVAALDKLAELCARLSGLPCQVVCWQGPRGSVCASAAAAITLTAICTVNACVCACKSFRVFSCNTACGLSRVLLLNKLQARGRACQVTLHTHAGQLSCPAGHVAGGTPGVPATGRGEASGNEGGPYQDRAFSAEQAVVGALRGVAQLGGASRALALALARAGALGAAMRLAERCPYAHLAPGHGEQAGVASSLVRDVLHAMRRNMIEVRARRVAPLQSGLVGLSGYALDVAASSPRFSQGCPAVMHAGVCHSRTSPVSSRAAGEADFGCLVLERPQPMPCYASA